MIDPARIKDEFIELAGISSLSRREGAIARRLESILKGMGASVEVDDAGEKIGGETGNLLARFAGTKAGAPPFLLSAHMDTVGPADKIRLVVDGDIVRTDRSTVLGGDDKAGIVAIFEAIRVLRERNIPHGDIEVVLSICEETGLVTGLEAHAGICPERGMSAIQIASEAIAGMKLGRVDGETTANLGVIQGGLSTNIVPTRVVVNGEARSLDVEKLEAQTRHMRGRFEEAAARHSVRLEDGERKARVEVKVDRQYERLNVPDGAPVVALVAGAARELGRPFKTRATGGGSDANVYAARGIEIANLGCGMRDIHTVNEWVDLRDLHTTASIVLETVRLNAVSP